MVDDFFPPDRPVPEEVQTPDFRLEPLSPVHVELDYAALMESKEMLRLWSGGPWPQDDFTLADNEADLVWHEQEHRQRIAFTFTVLSPGRDRCLGCVYIKSLARLAVAETTEPERAAEYGPLEAAVRFWVTAPQLAQELDRQLLRTLRRWFAEEWPLRRVLFHTRLANEQQMALFREQGLEPACTLTMPGRGGAHRFWEEPRL
jgi:hypothetical protein